MRVRFESLPPFPCRLSPHHLGEDHPSSSQARYLLTSAPSQAGAAFAGGGGCPGSAEAVGSGGPSRGAG